MSAHTPGPWRVEDPAIRGMVATVVVDGLYIAHVDNVDGFRGNKKGASGANARLIAAAPELLAACKRVTDAWRDDEPLTLAVELALRAAIAKAEGREP